MSCTWAPPTRIYSYGAISTKDPGLYKAGVPLPEQEAGACPA